MGSTFEDTKVSHTRPVGIQEAMSSITLQLILSVHRMKVQARFQGEILRGAWGGCLHSTRTVNERIDLKRLGW